MHARTGIGMHSRSRGGIVDLFTWPNARMLGVVLLSLVTASTVAWFIERRVTELVLANLLARAADQVELGVVPRLQFSDFEPPYTKTKLNSIDARLDSMLDRARESGSHVIRIDLFARDGTVLYSDLASLQGHVVSPLADPLLAAALAGSPSAEVSSLTRPEDADLKLRYGTALEAYVPCMLQGRVAGAYEVYMEPKPLEPIGWAIWTSIGLGFALVVTVTARLLGRSATSSVMVRAGDLISTSACPSVIRTGLIRLPSGRDGAVASEMPQAAGAVMPARVNPASECWLSRRETEVLRLLASRRTYRDIAGELSVSEETVRSHVKSILHKLGQPDRARAVAAAVEAGILPA